MQILYWSGKPEAVKSQDQLDDQDKHAVEGQRHSYSPCCPSDKFFHREILLTEAPVPLRVCE
jgi:hypothetical protein